MELSPPTIEYPISKTTNESKRPSKLNEDISKSELNRTNSNNDIYNISNKKIDNNSYSMRSSLNSSNLTGNTDKSKNESKNVCIAQSELNFDIDMNIRNKFMLKVFGILLIQFMFTFGLILICQIQKVKNYLIKHIYLYASLMGIAGAIFLITFIIFMCKPQIMKKVPQNYIILFIITICETVLLIYISILYSFEYILGAISFVMAIYLSIFFISLINKISIKYFAMGAVTLCFIGLTYGLLALILRNYYLNFLYCLIGSIIFALFIVYDTQMIRDHYDVDDYIFAALTLYFDVIRFFIQILKLLAYRDIRK